MKRKIIASLIVVGMLFTGCTEEEKVPKENKLPILTPTTGNVLEETHNLGDILFTTKYDTGEYSLSRWRITDSKVINIKAKAEVPEGAIVMVEHVHIDMSLKSTNPQLDGLSQDSMDDSFHGSSQDGFLITTDYEYQNIFAIEGFSKSLIDGWTFSTGEYGSGTITEKRLTENNLIYFGDVYANKMQIVYDLLIKYEGEEFFHVASVIDEFLIPVPVDLLDTGE